MDYFETLRSGLDRAYAVASEARGKGFDPSDKVEILVAKDVAARVEGLVGPPGIADVIRKMEEEGLSRSAIAFRLAETIAAGELCKGTTQQLIEQAVRTGVALLTEGVLVAPTEGISKVEINENPDGSNYVSMFFAGPIRSAGGTVSALSVVLADIARRKCGINNFRPTETEIARYVEEVNTYENRCVHLQYKPPDEHIAHIVRNCPICIDGDPTEEVEVSVHRDLERVKGNRVRGGIPLVVCEGIAQKAPKVLKQAKKYGLDWDWLQEVIKVKTKADKVEVKPDPTYLEGLVAGRPVFSYPMAKGGFRLRYGRSRSNGIMARNIHPATMVLLGSFPANGTHFKVERPGKGCVVTVCDSIEPPVVKLKDGSVQKVRAPEEAESLLPQVEKILFLGDMLVTFGDFLKSNHPLMPSGYSEEWWEAELDSRDIPLPSISNALEAFEFSRKNKAPLHPGYTFPWHDLSLEQLSSLAAYLSKAKLTWEGNRLKELELPPGAEKSILEDLYIEHRIFEGKVLFSGDDGYSLLSSLGLLMGRKVDSSSFRLDPEKSVMENLQLLSGITIRKKCPTYIGARMGRPEKAKERIMPGSPNILFPTGSPKNRSLIKLYRSLKGRQKERGINVEIARFRCTECGKLTLSPRCHSCSGQASLESICQKCGKATNEKFHCDLPTQSHDYRPVELISLMEKIKSELGFLPPELKGVKGLFSDSRIPERLEKGFLRAKHMVYVYKDGTCRFDATDVPLTNFRISEINQTVEGIRALGYTQDHLGKPITSEDQIIALKPQDILISRHGLEYMARVARFIDDLLVNLYGLQPFYRLREDASLLGHMFLGLSPHTSAGVLCRLIGYTDANVGYAHPYFHTAKRRNCFTGDTTIPVFQSGEWNIVQLKDFVESNLNGSSKTDAFGTVFSEMGGAKTIAFNKSTNKFELADITHVSKHLSQNHLIEIRTKSGRKLKVTKEHPFPNGNGKTDALSINGALIPSKIEIPAKDVEEFDLADFSEDISVKVDAPIFAGKSPADLARKAGINYKAFTNYLYRKSYPLKLLKKLGVPESRGWKIAAKRDKVTMNRFLKADEDLFFLLGIYLAEGYSRKVAKSHYQVCITACRPDVKKGVANLVKKVFGITPTVDERQVIIPSRIIHSFFEGLDLGKSAREKRLPSFILSLPEPKIKAFLRGFFTGDGSSTLGSTLEVNATSVSKHMLDQISFLLHRLGIIHSFSESERLINSRLIMDFYGKPKFLHSYKIRIYGEDAASFITDVGFDFLKGEKARKELSEWLKKRGSGRRNPKGDAFLDKVISKSVINADSEHVYSLTVSPHHTVISSGMVSHQCDGDEDAIMLLMDALLNFSFSYLSSKRGGTMDAPLLLTPMIDPLEVDDEVHGMEVQKYPLEFYETCERFAFPGEVKLRLVKDLLGKPEQYGDLGFMFDTSTLNTGPMTTAYVRLGSIPEKIEAEFALHSLIRAVDSKDAAERLILSHFIPDIYGNLRSFSRQTFRCVDCNEIYRRPPLMGKCRKCGGKIILTINKGGIEKYLKVSMRMVDDYGLPPYLKQRLELVEKEIRSVFEDEKIEQKGLSDFM